MGRTCPKSEASLSLEPGSPRPMPCPHDKLSQPKEGGFQCVMPLDAGAMLTPKDSFVRVGSQAP